MEDHSPERRRSVIRRTRAQRALLTVIFARRENARREEDGPVCSRGHIGDKLRRGLGPCRCGRADLAAAPRPEGSRPSGRGRPAASCPRPRPALAWSSRRFAQPSDVLASPRLNSAEAGRPGAPVGLALEAVEKVVTAKRGAPRHPNLAVRTRPKDRADSARPQSARHKEVGNRSGSR